MRSITIILLSTFVACSLADESFSSPDIVECMTDNAVPQEAPELPEPAIFPVECQDMVEVAAGLLNGSFVPSMPERWNALPPEWEPTPPVDPAAAGSGACNIDRVSASDLTPDEFRAMYLEKRPVIIVNATQGAEFARMTQKRVLLYCFGDFDVTLSTANKNSYNKFEANMKYYVTQMMGPQPLDASGVGTKYFFGDNRHVEWSDLFENFRMPKQYIWSHASLSFGAGGSGSGVPFHTHGHVFAEVFHGQKRWFLQQPGPEPRFMPDESSLRWAVNIYPTYSADERAKILDCVCVPGETIYIPSFWHHATLNLGETVFMSTFV